MDHRAIPPIQSGMQSTVGNPQLGLRRLGRGSPVVLLNGYAATGADWDPHFLASLACERELFCLDYRGLGGSAPSSEPFGMVDLAQDVAAAIAELEIEHPAVLGWSMGGYVAQTLSLARPELVGALILLATDPGGPRAIKPSTSVQARLFDLSGTPREQARRLLSLLFPPGIAEHMDAEFGEVVANARARLVPSVLRMQANAMAHWADSGCGEAIARSSLPTLIATGTEDVVIPPANALLLARTVSDSWLVRFRGGGHAFMAQFPEALARLLGVFLDQATQA